MVLFRKYMQHHIVCRVKVDRAASNNVPLVDSVVTVYEIHMKRGGDSRQGRPLADAAALGPAPW